MNGDCTEKISTKNCDTAESSILLMICSDE